MSNQAASVVTSATSLTLDTPAQTTPGASITLTGTYGGSPQALDYNFGSGWVEASSAAFNNGIFTVTVPAGMAVGSYVPEIRDHTATSVVGTAGNFVVSNWTPETLTSSPGAAVVFEFDANNPALVATGANGAVGSVLNSVNTAESLTARTGSSGNPILVANNSGADGKSRVLQFQATKISPNNADPSTNWLSAGGVNGSAGSALVDLANSSNLSSNGSFTAVIALDIDKSYSYEAGPIWGTLASPGPLQYAQLRVNDGSGAEGAGLTDSNLVGSNASGTVTAGWHVMTMIKTGNTLTYRLDGQLVATSKITSTASFTAQDFMIGGGFPPSSSSSAGAENGVPAPYVGEFQAYSGVLSGTDLANAEKLAGNSIGLSLNPTVPNAATIALSAPGTVPEASSGAGVTVTETVSTTGLTGSIYEEVLTSAGAVESAFQPVTLGSNGQASFSVHLAKSGDYVRAVNSTTSPTVTANSSAVTITDPTPPPSQTLTGVLPSPLYTGMETVTGTGGVQGLQLERITQGTYNTPGQTGWVAATVAADGTWSVQLNFTKPGMLAHVYAENGGSTTVVDLVNGTPANPPATSASMNAVAASVQTSTASDMVAKAAVVGSSAASILPASSSSSGAALSVLTPQTSSLIVPDHLQLLHST